MTWHVAGAVIVTIAVFWTVIRVIHHHAQQRGLLAAAVTLGSLLLAQLFLGGGSLGAKLYYADAPQPMPIFVLVTTVHVAIGALTLASSVVLALLLARSSDISQEAQA